MYTSISHNKPFARFGNFLLIITARGGSLCLRTSSRSRTESPFLTTLSLTLPPFFSLIIAHVQSFSPSYSSTYHSIARTVIILPYNSHRRTTRRSRHQTIANKYFCLF